MALTNNKSRYGETVTEKDFVIEVVEPQSNWMEWVKILGEWEVKGDRILLKNRGEEYILTIEKTKKGYTVSLPLDTAKKAPLFIKNLKTVFRKAAYCINCGTCEANCIHGVLKFTNGQPQISNCKHCGGCSDILGGCLLYYTNRTAKGEKNIMSKSINSYAAHGPRYDWIEAFFRYNGDFHQGVSLGSVQIPMFKRFLRDAELLNGDKFSDFAKTIKDIGLTEINAWQLMLVNLAYSPQIGWYIKNVLPNHTYQRDDFIALIEEQGINHDSASVVSTAFKLILRLPFGKDCGLGAMSFKGENEKNIISVTRSVCAAPDSTVILYALYKFAEACEGYYQFTLDRLMDFDIDSKGISPAQIFGLDEQTLSALLRGLSAKYPDFINYSETLGLRAVNLRKDKTAKSVLDLF